jgi:hypothetical protein
MKKLLISSVSAAAMMAVSSIAVAQDKEAGGGSGPGASAPAARDFGGSGTAPSAEKSKPSAEEMGRGAEAGGKPHANERTAKDGAAKNANEGAAKDGLAKKDAAKDGKDTGNAATGAGSGEQGQAAPGSAADGSEMESKPAEPKQGAAHVSLNADQRSRVNTAFKGHKGNASVSVNVDVRVGARLPGSIALVAIPSDVIVVVPEWRRYKYIVVGDTVCIVDPDTFEIIDVIVLA